MRRGRLLILIGLILACGTAAVVFLLLQNVSKTPAGAEIKTEKVVVVAQPLKEGEVVDGRLELADRAVPVPEDALRTLDGTTGMLAKGDLSQSTIVTAGMLQTKEELMAKSQLGNLVEVGYVAVALPISELSSVSYGIQPNDLVDILISFAFIDVDNEMQIKEPLCPPICPAGGGEEAPVTAVTQIPRLATQLTLQHVRVLGVGRWSYQAQTETQTQQTQQGQEPVVQPPDYITLMLLPQDALVLKLARETQASIDLAVRQKEDMQDFTTQQVTLEYLMTRFSISVPTKHDYALDMLPEPTPEP
ncbi:MAG: Flp pilus assembly protein CpaB [Anaerolineae bacterium]|nr:Flp pilus assembly protein CpaB [Anaerolineae bacterium]